MRMVLPKQGAALLPAVRDVGEAAVSALARERGSSLVLVEERKARQVARAVYGLQPIGSARILIAAKRKNLLAGIAGPLAELRREGFWIHQDIVRVAVREAGERGSENQAQLICRNAR